MDFFGYTPTVPCGTGLNNPYSQFNPFCSCYEMPSATIIVGDNKKSEFDPDFVKDVKILAENKVVQVTFKDGTSEKAVCNDEDNFSLEIGISICIAKKILGGTGKYNSAIRKAMKIIESKKKAEEKEEEERERILKRRKKREEYLKKRELKKREEQIKIQEEAYYRAMKKIEGEENKNEK